MTRPRSISRRRWIVALVPMAGLAGCARPPLRIGFLNEVHGADANFGEDARNGAMLGIEQCNAAGGIAGRPVELVVHSFDHRQARGALQALQDAGAEVLVGPFGTRLALQLLPMAETARVLMLSPTVTSQALVGKDDQLLRLNLTNGESAQATARMLRDAGCRRIALARDVRNAEYAVAWGEAFRAAVEATGGAVVDTVDFGLEPALSFEAVVRHLLAGGPDGLMFVASGADAARLAQQARKHDAGVLLAAAAWAATPALIELGGQAVEGLLVAQAHNPQDRSPRFLAFQRSFRERFDEQPGYGAACAYDAVLVLVQALQRADAGESPKEALLRHGPYDGLQQSIAFDRFGDARRAAHATVVRGGRFELR